VGLFTKANIHREGAPVAVQAGLNLRNSKLVINPGPTNHLFGLGLAYMWTGQYEEAIK
jgi:hypothetical protein